LLLPYNIWADDNLYSFLTPNRGYGRVIREVWFHTGLAIIGEEYRNEAISGDKWEPCSQKGGERGAREKKKK
jgi:hypothetical protein